MSTAARSFLAGSLGLLLGIPAWAGIPADLKVIRSPGSVQLVLMGMGANPEIRVGQQGAGLEIEVTTSQATELAAGIRQLSLTDVGFASVELDGGGNRFVLRVQPVQGRGVPKPVVTDDGQSVRLTFAAQTMPQQVAGSYNIRTPGQVPVSNFVPPLRQRAYAPPVGDMAVGTMVLRNPSYVALKGPPVTLTTRNASARDVLMLLAQMGGYNFAFADVGAGSQIGNQSSSSSSGSTQSTSGGGVLPPGGGLVTVAFQREPLERAFNFVLLSSGLQARLDGSTVVVGLNVLTKTIGNTVSRVYRLNQVSPDGAADYLANLGATITKTNTITSTSNESSSTGVATANASASTSSTSTQTVVESFGAPQGPLKGLIGTTDKRLGTITLIGGSYLVSVAEGYLKQLDLRKRQVAVNVKILNIDLENTTSIDNSFTAQIGDTFIVNASGQALVNFGSLKPSSSDGQGLGLYRGDSGSPMTGAYGFRLPEDQRFLDVPKSATPYSPPGETVLYPYSSADTNGVRVRNQRPGFGPYDAPWQAGQLKPTYNSDGSVNETVSETAKNMKYPPNKIFDYLTASIKSGSAKSLADPTLLVQEGESAKVEAVTSVITGVTSSSLANNTTTSTTTREDAGLTLKVEALKIDDNGFVTLNLRPEVSIAIPNGGEGLVGGVKVSLNDITKRSLDSGKIRLRDGQTLFLTGVIQESNITDVSKWPILGDLPFFGQFFRKTGNNRRKSELVIVVTPRIIDDEQGGSYGYGFQPSSAEARRLIYPK